MAVEPGDGRPLAHRREHIDRRRLVHEAGDGVQKGVTALPGHRRNRDGLRVGAAGVADGGFQVLGAQQVGLVPDLQDAALVHVDAEAGQHLADIAGLGMGFGAGDVADMQDDVGLLHLLQGGAEGLDQLVRQVGDEAHGVGHDGGPPVRQLQHPKRRVEGGEQHVLGHHLGLGQAVEEGRLAGVGVADQGHCRVRMPLAGRALQGARAAHLLQLGLQLADLVGDQPAVGLDLGFAGAAHDPEAAALALQVGPGPHQARALVGEPGQLHLQPPFPRPRPPREDLQDQAGAVDDLAVPGLLEIALLHRRERVVDHGDVDLAELDDVADFLHLALAEQGGGRQAAQGRDQGLADLQVEGQRQAHGLLQAHVGGPGGHASVPVGVDDNGALDRRLTIYRF